MSLRDERDSYERGELRAADLLPDPTAQLEAWLEERRATGAPEPGAAALATADAAGSPSVRMVLLKEIGAEGLVFFSHAGSRKGRALAENPRAELLLFWAELQRQVRIHGPVERLPEARAEAYFARRPRASRIGALASPQSRVIASRAVLEARVAEIRARYGDEDEDGAPIPRPEGWHGYALRPERYEFWQGRADRLHDRFRYRPAQPGSGETAARADGAVAWVVERLAP